MMYSNLDIILNNMNITIPSITIKSQMIRASNYKLEKKIVSSYPQKIKINNK